MNTRLLLLTTALSLAYTTAWASLATPAVNGDRISWDSFPAATINIHRGDGSYVESLPGKTTAWTAPAPGDYYLVASNEGPWQSWPRSETITITNPSAPQDAITGLRAEVYSRTAAEVFWDRVPADGTRYRVVNGAEVVAETEGTSWFSDNFTPGSTTITSVQALDADGVESASRSVAVTTPGDQQAQPYPTISRDNHEALLTKVFGMYFGMPYREPLFRMANETVPELQAAINPDFSAGNPYACINGGEVAFEGPFTLQFDDCRIEDAVYQGAFNC